MAVFLPRSLEEALDTFARVPEAQLFAGGTDFMVQVNAGARRPAAVISLRGVPELKSWRRDASEVVLGAGLTYTEMLAPHFADLVPLLAQAARTIGSPQIRNAGTIGGNLGTCSPAGDTLPALAVLGARIGVGRPGSTRTVALDELMTGPKRNNLEPGEIIIDVRLPAALGTQEFLKVGPRNAMIIAVANVALLVDWGARQVRVALGSVGPVIMRPTEAEAFVASQIVWGEPRITGGETGLDEFARLVRGAARPIDDHRSTAEYRLHAVGVCARRALERALRHQQEAALIESLGGGAVGELSDKGPALLSYGLRVNGRRYEVDGAELCESLLYALRERLGLRGPKNACLEGECGSCSVLIDGVLECACTVLAAAAADRDVVTIEGLTPAEGELSDIQEAFVAEGAVQCGFCTPGLVVSVHDLLTRNPAPTDLEVREAISGNLCRCTGYGRILAAVHAAAASRGAPS